jgi:hypothetical protein
LFFLLQIYIRDLYERKRERDIEKNIKRENVSREKRKRKEEIGYEKITYY